MKPHANLHAISNPLMALRATANASSALQDGMSNGAADTGFASIMAQQLTQAAPGEQALTETGESDPCLSLCDALKKDDEVALQAEPPLATVPAGAEGMVWAAPVVALPDTDPSGGGRAATADIATDTAAHPLPLLAAQTPQPKDRANVLQTVTAGAAPVAETSENVADVAGRERGPVPAADTPIEPSLVRSAAVQDKPASAVLPRPVNDARPASVDDRSAQITRSVMSSTPERSGRATVQWVQSAQSAHAMPGVAPALVGGQVRDQGAVTSSAVAGPSTVTVSTEATATEVATASTAAMTTAPTPASSARMEREHPPMDLTQPDTDKPRLEATEVAQQAVPKPVDSSSVGTVLQDSASAWPTATAGVSQPRQVQSTELAGSQASMPAAAPPTLTRVASGNAALTLENLLANASKTQKATPSTVDAFASRSIQRAADDKAGQTQPWATQPADARAGQAPEPTLAATPNRPAIEHAPAELSRPGERPEMHEAAPQALTQAPMTSLPLPVASFVRHESATLQQTVGTPAFADELIGQVKVWVNQTTDEGPMTAELHLNPADMGPVMVRIEVDGQSAQVNFAAQHAETRQAIEASLSMLSASLEEAGIQLSGSGVSDQSNSSQQAWGFESRGDGQPRQSSQAFAMASEQGQTGLRPSGDRADDEAWRPTPASRPASSANGLDLYA